MSVGNLPVHPGLHGTTRLRIGTSTVGVAGVRDWALLLLFGVLAAASSALLDFGMRMPGHAILRCVPPMAAGLAVVPRRGAGTVMGFSALFTSMAMRVGGLHGEGLSLGALTSLTATGPILDLCLWKSRGGWRQYLAFAGAGLASNALAFAVRGTAKAIGFEHAGSRPLGDWLQQAWWSYALFGVIAGLVSGAILFASRPKGDAQGLRESAAHLSAG